MMKCDVLIAGGGVAGMVLAVLLKQGGLKVILADAAPPPAKFQDSHPDGRTAALMGRSIDILEDVGIWPVLKNYSAPLKRMAVVDDSRFPAGFNAMVEQIFDASELSREAFGWNIPLSAARAVLATKMGDVKYMTRATLTTFKVNNSVIAHLSNGHDVEAALLVGCDGRDSSVREQSGINATRRVYHQNALTCLISHARPHDDTSVEFHRRGGPFTIVPMQGNTSAIVWVEKENDARALLKLPKDAFTRALQERTRDRLGAIELVTTPASWPLEYLRADKLTAPRVALAAEAAHVISPIGAQGLNLSLRDVRGLAEIIIQAKNVGLDIGSQTVLDRYERARKGDVASRSFAIDLVNQAVANDTGAMRMLRRLTLRALSLPGPWRQIVMKKGLAA